MKHVLDTFMLSDCDFLANQNMRKIRALVCDFLTVSDILDIYAMHRSCESTFDFLTASDFLGKQFLNPTQKQKIYLHGDPFLVKACFVDRFLGECFLRVSALKKEIVSARHEGLYGDEVS